MYYDRFDIAEAHYWWLATHHEGQSSAKYERLCGIPLKPGLLSSGPSTENGQAIYANLCEREGCTHDN